MELLSGTLEQSLTWQEWMSCLAPFIGRRSIAWSIGPWQWTTLSGFGTISQCQTACPLPRNLLDRRVATTIIFAPLMSGDLLVTFLIQRLSKERRFQNGYLALDRESSWVRICLILNIKTGFMSVQYHVPSHDCRQC